MMKKSWVYTVATQFLLCLSFFLVLNMCQKQKLIMRNGNENNLPMDIYFISVIGGIRTLQEQTLLLKQVEKVAKKFNARFIINISELGEDDPLMQNATWHFPSVKIPWYSTRVLKGQGVNHYLKQFKFVHGSLDVIVVDTGLYVDVSSGTGDRQSQWLIDTLENSESKWSLAVGFHPLVACKEDTSQTELKHQFQSLHGIFLKYGVDAYISGQACPDNVEKRPIAKSKTGTARYRGPLLTKMNQNLPYSMEKVNGFLLHKVSALEIVSYLVTLEGDVVQKIFLHQRGKDVM